jgi:enterochelin esterase-like enzyme
VQRIARLIAAAVLYLPLATYPADQPTPSSGSVTRLEAFPSRYVAARNVDLWLPAGYNPAKRYAVLYMQDGQMLYDARTTWNKQAWNVDAALTRLTAAGRITETIVVGIWNSGTTRHSEYFPEKFLPFVSEPLRTRFIREALAGAPLADRYLRFLVEELKPAIDARYPTRPGRESTFLMGSSMGGLISLYAMSEYPEVFGGAACLSTHWPGTAAANAAFPLAAFNYLQTHLPDPATHRLYMDHGTKDIDALYGTDQAFVDQIVRERGYTNANWQTRVVEGAGHNEHDWSARLEEPLLLLLSKR